MLRFLIMLRQVLCLLIFLLLCKLACFAQSKETIKSKELSKAQVLNTKQSKDQDSQDSIKQHLIGQWYSEDQKIKITIDQQWLSIIQKELLPAEARGLWFLTFVNNQYCLSFSYLAYYFSCFLNISASAQPQILFHHQLLLKKNLD